MQDENVLSDDTVSTEQVVLSLLHSINYGQWYDYYKIVSYYRTQCNLRMTMTLLEEILLKHMEDIGYVFEIKKFGENMMCIKFEKLGVIA